MNSLDLIDRLPWEFAARLEADEYLADVAVVVAEDGNVEQELKRQQAVITARSGKRGAAIIVLPTLGEDEHPNIAFGPMTLYPSFQVIENLTLNRDANGTGKSARKIARRVRDVIKVAGMTGFIMDLKPERPCIEPVSLGDNAPKTIKALQVNFRCIEVCSEIPTQVQLPAFAAVEGQQAFSIACATAGASIYYTLDDSYPRPGNGVVYVGPVAIPAGGLTVRACAKKAGMIDSWVNRAVINVS